MDEARLRDIENTGVYDVDPQAVIDELGGEIRRCWRTLSQRDEYIEVLSQQVHDLQEELKRFRQEFGSLQAREMRQASTIVALRSERDATQEELRGLRHYRDTVEAALA